MLVGDWLLLQELVGKGLTMVTVMMVVQRLVLVGKGLLLVDRDMRCYSWRSCFCSCAAHTSYRCRCW
jgi:predicted transcriptional regulator